MANFVVWIDQAQAKVFELHPDNVKETTTHRRETGHQGDHGDGNEEKFFCSVAANLREAHEVLLLGPGLAKNHFKDHLARHHHSDIAKKVVATETVDHPTEGQVVALAKKFFKAHLRFE